MKYRTSGYQHPQYNRRQMLAASGVGLFQLTAEGYFRTESLNAANLLPANRLRPLNRFPRMVHEYFVERMRQAEQVNLKAKSDLKTKEDAEAYVRSVQQRIRQCFAPFPAKTPLNPRVTKVVERDAYTIQNLIFESRPGFLVTSNLYIPKGRKFPLPGVVGTCGHSANGKAAGAYQSFAQGLARQGYVVLIYDPIGQGERLQYVNEELESQLRPGTLEHLYAGNQQFLVGEFFGSWRAWDGIRALDYLLTREEVDPRHVGVTGNSGGGTMTTWLCGLERRWTMAAPSCFVTTFRRNMENELPADTEQCPPGAIATGLDHDDFIAAMAPKPVILLGKEKDYFDARGFEEAYGRLKRLYGLLGVEQNIAKFLGPTYHGYSQENREAMYHWFNRITGVSDANGEPEIVIEPDETLWCTPHGQVAELKSRTVYSFTRQRAEALRKNRSSLDEDQLRRAVLDALKIETRGILTGAKKVPEYRIIRARQSRDYPTPYFITYVVATQPGIHAIMYRLTRERLYSRPPQGQERAVLYVPHRSSDVELREEPLISETIKGEPNSAFFTCDVRGIGESQPGTCGPDNFDTPYGSDFFYSIHSLMLNDPYVGQRTYDILRVLEWLHDNGHTKIHLMAKGWGSVPAAFAALLSERVVQVTLKNALASYSAVAESETYHWPLSSFIPTVLENFDLPDCYRVLVEKKRLRMVESG